MKPVVSSIVALAIAIAPFAAMATPENHKPVAAKVTKHTHHHKKVDKSDKEKAEKSDAVVRVQHSGKTILKPVLHHAHNADVGGAGHKEPKIENGGVSPASLTTKPAHGKTAHASHKADAKP